MASFMGSLKPGSDARGRSHSVAGPGVVPPRITFTPPQRKLSRALDVKPAKSQIPLWHWIQQNVDKQLIGLSINFLILVVLLMLLSVFVQWIQVAQMATKGAPKE